MRLLGVAPREYWSDAAVAASPRAHSGAMYLRVLAELPVSPARQARPKSPSLTAANLLPEFQSFQPL